MVIHPHAATGSQSFTLPNLNLAAHTTLLVVDMVGFALLAAHLHLAPGFTTYRAGLSDVSNRPLGSVGIDHRRPLGKLTDFRRDVWPLQMRS
jgi:hypothetical protein